MLLMYDFSKTNNAQVSKILIFGKPLVPEQSLLIQPNTKKQYFRAFYQSTDVTSTDLVSAKGKTKEVYCCDIYRFDRSILMFLISEGLQCQISIETLSDEAVKRYQSADFYFPLCRN